MASEMDLLSFLKIRNIPDNIINKLKDDKIDISIIEVMTDEELGQYIVRYGDRLALRAFCRQRTVANKMSAETTVKSGLMQKVRDRLGEQRKTFSSDKGHGAGNKYAAKDTRRVEIGWLHFHNGTYHQVRTKNGGGTRHLSVQKTVTMGDLLEIGKGLFFPNGQSAKGSVEDFEFDIRDFSHNPVSSEATVSQLYEQSKLRLLRIYTSSQAKNVTVILSDSSSDLESADKRPMKIRTMPRQSLRKKNRRRNHWKTGTDHQVDHPERSSDSEPAPNGSMQEYHERRGNPSRQSRPAPAEMSNVEILHPPSSDDDDNHTFQSTTRNGSEDECLMPVSNQDADQLLNDKLDPPLALAIQASLEDYEIHFGPVYGDNSDDQDLTLPWNPHDLNSMQHSTLNDGHVSSNDLPGSKQFEKELLSVKLRRVNIVDDLLNVFMEPKVLNVDLKIEFTNEKAVDSQGVSREAYSAFWEHFLEQCEGEDERVPRLRPDYSEKEWQAVGRVWLKGYMDHNIIPIRLSPAFVLACCHGVSSVDEELLMMSFANFLSVDERASVAKALEGSMDETAEEDLLEVFSRMGSHCLPSKDNLRAAILTMAHKALLQEPKFIIDCFYSSIHNAVPTLITKDSIMELYESKRPTNKKVAQMIKPSSENLNPQEPDSS